jgi:hypothetical protein
MREPRLAKYAAGVPMRTITLAAGAAAAVALALAVPARADSTPYVQLSG